MQTGFNGATGVTTVYLATDTRLVLGCENVSALETAWKEVAAVASR
jgi:hypothetical protein